MCENETREIQITPTWTLAELWNAALKFWEEVNTHINLTPLQRRLLWDLIIDTIHKKESSPKTQYDISILLGSDEDVPNP